MSTKINGRVWEKSQHWGTTLNVFLAIGDQAHGNGVAWSSVDTIAQMARIKKLAALEHVSGVTR